MPDTLGDEPPGLVVLLHGAGGGAATTFANPATALATRTGSVLLVPESRGRTWDVVLGGFGPDVAFLDLVLERTFAEGPIDPARVVLAGFSDGASYVLSLGVLNPRLFGTLIAFAPGFLAATPTGDPQRAWVAHGLHDAVLPIDRCSRRIVPALRAHGVDVEYHEFDGGHEVPLPVAAQAVAWLERGTPALRSAG